MAAARLPQHPRVAASALARRGADPARAARRRRRDRHDHHADGRRPRHRADPSTRRVADRAARDGRHPARQARRRRGRSASSPRCDRLARDGGLAAAPQPAEGATYAAKIGPADAAIDWRSHAAAIDRQIRAFDPAPGAFTALAGAAQAAGRASPSPASTLAPAPGTVVAADAAGIASRAATGRAAHHRIAARRRQADGARPTFAAGRRDARVRFDVGPVAHATAIGGSATAGRARRAPGAARRGAARRACRRRDGGGATRERTPPRAGQELATARCGTGARSPRSPRARGQAVRRPVARRARAVALYQLEHTRAPPFAVVDHAVNAAAALARPAAKALVNALLRRYLREREALDARGARRPGRALVASALVDRARKARLSRTTGRRSSRRATRARRSRCA